MKKRILMAITCFIILIVIVAFIILTLGEKTKVNSDKLQIITTIYPEYDFACHIVGDKIDVIRLIGSGVEIHTYEPSVKDMKKISDSDMFIYTGNAMEPWAKTIIDSIKENNLIIVDSSQNIKMINIDEFMDEFNDLKDDNHHEEHTEYEYELDGHIWMNPQNAVIMLDTILENIIKIDPQNADYYKQNAEQYKAEILELDALIETALKENNIDTLVFGGEFAYSYFCQRYSLKVVSCYEACGEGTEPSISKIKDVIDYINSKKITKVFYEELSEGTVAQMLAEETAAKALVFNTLHNVSKEEIDENENYITIMKANLEKIIN